MANLVPYKEGHCPVLIEYQRPGAKASMKLGREWLVQPADELVISLQNVLGKKNVVLLYE